MTDPEHVPGRHPHSGKRYAALNQYSYDRLSEDEKQHYRWEVSVRRWRYMGSEPTTSLDYGNVRGL